MRRGPRSYAEQVRTRLLDLWQGDEGFGRPLGCLATTYTFNAGFFEDHCLGRFLGIQSSADETANAYVIEREEKLSQSFACVLVDQAQAAQARSLRWHQLPISVPGGGAQHSKLSILLWENHARVLIGSANLTDNGYRVNQEQMAVFDFSPSEGLDGALLLECCAFVRRLCKFAPGFDRSDVGPQAALASFLEVIERRARELPSVAPSENPCFLVQLIPGSEQRMPSVLEQLQAQWQGPAPNEAWVVSPFFNEDAEAARVAQALARLLTTRGQRSITFMAPGRRLADGTPQLDLPSALTKPSHPSLTHRFMLIAELVGSGADEAHRRLHAKSIWLQRYPYALFLVGSSNFTSAGLGLHPRHNVELNVCYVLRNRDSKFAALCDRSYPVAELIDDPSAAQFLGAQGQSSEDSDIEQNPLHSAFGLALFKVEQGGSLLELEIAKDAPVSFRVVLQDGQPLASYQTWTESGQPLLLSVPWMQPRPPSSVWAEWTADGEKRRALWIVNVADASTLPSAGELAELTLDELIAILTSARPLHEIVMAMVQARARRKSTTAYETDPHRRIDTSQYLLRRMRRASDAFEGMRQRLEEPLLSIEALRWRLYGPVGPLTFAEKILKSEREAAAFIIAELAGTLRQVKWRSVGGLTSQSVKAEVETVQAKLCDLARQTVVPANLAEYVDGIFGEVRQ
jgi:hypothetical protein